MSRRAKWVFDMDVVKTGEIALKLLRALTLKRVGLLALTVLIAIIGMIAWIDREYLAGTIQPAKLSIDNSSPLALNDVKRIPIDKILKEKTSIVSSIGIVSVNAQANTRRLIYFDSNDQNVLRQYKDAVESRVSVDVPLFSSNSDDNKVLIRLLNGELVCRPWDESVTSRYLQNVDIKYVCSVGVPPVYGRFRGIVIMFLRVEPSEYDSHRIRILLRKLSFELDDRKDL